MSLRAYTELFVFRDAPPPILRKVRGELEPYRATTDCRCGYLGAGTETRIHNDPPPGQEDRRIQAARKDDVLDK
jgi:hypothetical protein